jgi:hypothetical protein
VDGTADEMVGSRRLGSIVPRCARDQIQIVLLLSVGGNNNGTARPQVAGGDVLQIRRVKR